MKVTAASLTATAGTDAQDVAVGLRRVAELIARFGRAAPRRYPSGYRRHRPRNRKRGALWP
jgi:predicted alpha/beta-hydrolase family hydrolase